MVVTKLVERGLVQRATSKHDARRQELELTPQGRALVRRMPEAAHDALLRALVGMKRPEVRQLARLMTVFVHEVAQPLTTSRLPAPHRPGPATSRRGS